MVVENRKETERILVLHRFQFNAAFLQFNLRHPGKHDSPLEGGTSSTSGTKRAKHTQSVN